MTIENRRGSLSFVTHGDNLVADRLAVRSVRYLITSGTLHVSIISVRYTYCIHYIHCKLVDPDLRQNAVSRTDDGDDFKSPCIRCLCSIW